MEENSEMILLLTSAARDGLELSAIYQDHGGVWMAQFARGDRRGPFASGSSRHDALSKALREYREEPGLGEGVDI